MRKFKGLPLASGLAIGKCYIIKNFVHDISKNKIEQGEIKQHLKKFQSAIKRSLKELESLQKLVAENSDQNKIIQSHKEILRDNELKDNIKKIIENKLYSVELAVHTYFKEYLNSFSNFDDEYLSLRKADFLDIKNNLIKNIKSNPKNNFEIKPGTIAITKTLLPSLVMKMFEVEIKGLVVEKGSKNSHSAILAKSIGIPVIYDVKNVINSVEDGNEVIINGKTGELIIKPDKNEIDNYKRQKREIQKEIEDNLQWAKTESRTKDDHKITVMGNIELAEETNKIEVKYSDGVGLFRTEFLYFLENKFPDIETQTEIYKKVIKNLDKNKPIFIRVFDIGGDKLHKEFGMKDEENPNLGFRGIRFLLEYPKIFKDQLKSILRASEYGNVKIMLPMICKYDEVVKCQKILSEAKKELENDNISFNENIDMGILIEIPSAALLADELAKISDFFSIGTNDLTQYVLAADRNNQKFGDDYNYFHRAVVLLIKNVIDAAKKNNIPVSICGEMASDPNAIPILLGLGIRMISVNIDKLLTIKKLISKYSVSDQVKQLKKVLNNPDFDLKNYYKKF